MQARGNVELRQNVIYRRKRESIGIHCLERTCATRFAIQGAVNWEVIGKDAPKQFPFETGEGSTRSYSNRINYIHRDLFRTWTYRAM